MSSETLKNLNELMAVLANHFNEKNISVPKGIALLSSLLLDILASNNYSIDIVEELLLSMIDRYPDIKEDFK